MTTTISAVATQSPLNPPITHPSHIVISEDLKQAAIDHIAYLKEYDDHPEYLQKQAREYAIYRYESFWLPFLAENADIDMVPPLDILIVWHSHMLAPISYASDCERLFGRILPNHVRTRTAQIVKFSEQLWTKKYARSMPYELNYTASIQVIPPYTSKIKYALSQAVERQVEFYYNVALGHYKDMEFLDEAVKRYKKFLYLKRLNPQLFIVPMYDIDLIWHTHQLFPDAYRRDTIANLQHVLHHDDSVQDRTANSKLSTADHETRHKWFELYGDRLPKNGCMYRGKTSRGFYQFVENFNFLLECQRYTIYVQFVEDGRAAPRKELGNRANTVVPLNDQSAGEPLRNQLFAQFNSSEQEIFVRGSSGYVEAHFEADFNDFSTALTLKVQQKAGYWPLNYFSSLAEFSVPAEKLLPIAQFNEPVQGATKAADGDDSDALYYLLDKEFDLDSPLRPLVPNATRLVAGVPAVDINTIIVRLGSSAYADAVLDQNYLNKLGTTFLFNLENIKVQQALHNIQPIHQDEPILLNIQHTIINDIDIFTATFNSAIFASCHTLNWSQLPLPEQVSTRHALGTITLQPEKEEALIIKDHTGDWGIVKFSKDLFTASLEDTADEKNYQFLLYRFRSDGSVDEEVVYVDWEDDKWLIGSDNFGIDMNSWSISVKRIELKNSMQYICLGAALITRFDTLFTQIFGKKVDEEAKVNGARSDSDLLANDIGTLNLNGTNAIKTGDQGANKQASQMAMNHV